MTEVLTPKFTQWAIDTLVAVPNTKDYLSKIPAFLHGLNQKETLFFLVQGFVVVMFLGLLGRFAWRQTLARRTHVAAYHMKQNFWNSLRFQPLKTFQDYTLGDLMNRATADWNSSRFIQGFTIVLTYDLVFFSVLAIAVMLLMNPLLTILSLATFFIVPPFMVKLANQEYDQHIFAQEKLSDLSDIISQTISTIRLQRAMAGEGPWQKTLQQEARDYADRRKEVIKTEWRIFPFGTLPTLVAYAILIFYGIFLIREGKLSIGEFVAFQSYLVMLQVPLYELNSCITEWQRGFGSLKRIVEIFNLKKPDNYKESTLHKSTSLIAISLNSASFEYLRGGRKILDQVSLDINAGEYVGISGAIGSGKTTLLRLIAGLLDPTGGAIKLFNQNLRDIERSWVTKQVSFVAQESFLFAGSLRYNLSLSDQYCDEELWTVLETVDLAKDIRKMSAGFDSQSGSYNLLDMWIGEWGVTLSGGQRQRLSMARALLRPRPIILFDDCFSAVDTITEENILKNLSSFLKTYPQKVTIIWTAHRMSTLSLCHRTYQLENAKLRSLAK